jgi:hypothetical protein
MGVVAVLERLGLRREARRDPAPPARPAATAEPAPAPLVRARPAPASQRPQSFVAAKSLPLLYVNMPKSGCTTIKNILQRFDGGAFIADPLTIHRRRDLLVRGDDEPDEIGRRLRRDPVFTFVRHPLKRAYSCFNEKVHFQTPYSFLRVRAAVRSDYGARFERAPSADLHRENFKAFLRFSADSHAGRNGWRRDPHWCPQIMMLQNARRWREIDFIGRIERFDADLKIALGLAGVALDIEVPRMNEGPAAPWPYEAMLDDEVRALGAALFADDLRFFGYSL